jgi:hypothetical protein
MITNGYLEGQRAARRRDPHSTALIHVAGIQMLLERREGCELSGLLGTAFCYGGLRNNGEWTRF